MAGNGTRLDGWMLNTANDRFGPIGDFDGDGRVEILVTNAWGVGILGLRGNTLQLLFMAANGARLDGWMLDTANDRFGPVADFDGDGRDEILVADGQGVMILALDANALHPIMTAANGVRLDGWLLNTANDRFGVAADLNGDGRAEVIVQNAWGIAVMGLEGSAFGSLVTAANGSHFGSWRLDTAVDRFGPAADLNGDGRVVLIVVNPQGLGVLAMRGNSLDALAIAANGTSLGDWVWEENDCIVDAWRSSGSAAKCELLIQKGSPCAFPSPFPVPVRGRRRRLLTSALASFALE